MADGLLCNLKMVQYLDNCDNNIFLKLFHTTKYTKHPPIFVLN